MDGSIADLIEVEGITVTTGRVEGRDRQRLDNRYGSTDRRSKS